MQSFTIRDIENLTGIKAHTLRIWEQRYDFFTPKRKESRHRFYDNEDLKRLLRISFLYHAGWKISNIASLSESEVLSTVRNTKIASTGYEPLVTQLLEAALDFEERSFTEALNEGIKKTGFEDFIVHVCYPYLSKVGHLWSTNNVIPAQEHFSSYLIQNRIIVETEKLPANTSKPDILLFCPQGEFHELPLLFINYLLRKNGWGTIYLGPNIQRNEVMEVAGLSKASYLYVHLITNFTGSDADDYFESICKMLPDKKIIASGEGTGKVQRNFVNLTLLKSDRQIYDFIDRKLKL
jgi:DNA-binding transcriptional MerR regulator